MLTHFIQLFVLMIFVSPANSQEVTSKVSLWGKPRAFTYHVEELARRVRIKTGGDFRIELHYGGLSKPRQNLEGLAAGAFEMAQFCAGYHPEKNRAITVLELPYLGVSSLQQELAVNRAIYQHPATQAEMANWNATLLMPTPLPQYNLVGRGSIPTSVDWMRGKRIRATGGIARTLGVFEAQPVSLTAPETREAFASGEIDAVAFAPHAHFAFDTISTAEWWTSNLNPGTVNCPVVVNAGSLEALSPKHRQALMDAVDPALDAYLSNYQGLLGKWADVIALFGKKSVEISPDVINTLLKAAPEHVYQAWIKEAEDAGLPAQDLLDLARQTGAVTDASN